MPAASALTIASYVVDGTATKNATTGAITVRGDLSGRAIATGVTWTVGERCVVRLDSHTGSGGAVIRWSSTAVGTNVFLDMYRSNAFGWYFGQRNAADSGSTSDNPAMGPLPVYVSLRFLPDLSPVFETSATPDGPWTIRRQGYPVAALTDYSVVAIEGRDGSASDVHTFAVGAAAAPPPDAPAATTHTVTWTGKSGSTVTRPSGTFYRATAPAAGNLEAESSSVPVTPGVFDVTLQAKRGAGIARSGDLYANLLRADGSYHSTAFLGPLPQTQETFTTVTGRVTVPDTVTQMLLGPAFYNAAPGDAVDLQPQVTTAVAGGAPPPPGGFAGTGLFLAGTPLAPLVRTLA